MIILDRKNGRCTTKNAKKTTVVIPRMTPIPAMLLSKNNDKLDDSLEDSEVVAQVPNKEVQPQVPEVPQVPQVPEVPEPVSPPVISQRIVTSEPPQMEFVGDVSSLRHATILKFNKERGYGFISIGNGDTVYFHLKQYREAYFSGSNIVLKEQGIPPAWVIDRLRTGVGVLYSTRSHGERGLYVSPWTLESVVDGLKEKELATKLYQVFGKWEITEEVSNNTTKRFETVVVESGVSNLGAFRKESDIKFAIRMFVLKYEKMNISFLFSEFDQVELTWKECDRPF